MIVWHPVNNWISYQPQLVSRIWAINSCKALRKMMNFPVNLPVFRGIIPVIFRFIWKGSRGTTPSLGDWTFRLTRNTLQTLWSGLFSAVVAGGPLQYLQGLGQEALQSQAAFLGVREREYQHIYYLTIFARCLFYLWKEDYCCCCCCCCFFCLAMKRLLVPLDLHNAQTVVKTDGAFHAKVESQDTVDMYTYVFLVL